MMDQLHSNGHNLIQRIKIIHNYFKNKALNGLKCTFYSDPKCFISLKLALLYYYVMNMNKAWMN